jgi:hypothetical protein
MATTLNKITYSILNKVRPHLPDDSDLTPEVVKYDVMAERKVLVEQYLGKRARVPEGLVSDLGCLELEIADAAECCTLSTTCKTLRTKKVLPEFIPIKNSYENSITRVGPIIKSAIAFSLIPVERVPSAGNGQFSNGIVFAYYMNDRIYIVTNNPTLKYVNVRGVLADPSDAKDFICNDGSTCFTDDDRYPVVGKMEAAIRKILLDTYLNQAKIPKDHANDANDKMTDRA